jgi:hypothetical protein
MKYHAPLTALIFAFVVTACGGDNNTSITPPVTSPPTTPSPTPSANIVIISQSARLEPDQSTQYTVKDAAGAIITSGLTWASSNISVAEVSDTGMVTAKTAGKSIISAKLGTLEATYELNVTFTLRIAVKPNADKPFTVFLNRSDGSLIESKVINAGQPQETLVFKNVAADTLVTGAYEYSKPYSYNGQNVIQKAVRLSSYPAAYISGRTFFLTSNDYIANVNVTLIKPTGINVTSAISVSPYYNTVSWGESANGNLNLYLSQSNLDSNGRFSPVFLAKDVNGNIVAYATLLNQTVTSDAMNLTVQATDWKTNFSSLPITIRNYMGIKDSSGTRTGSSSTWGVSGAHGNVSYGYPFNQMSPGIFNPANDTLSGSVRYVPNIFDNKMIVNVGFAEGDLTEPSYPFRSVLLVKNFNLPFPSAVTFDAKTDFLKPIANFRISDVNTAQFTATWDNPGNTFMNNSQTNLSLFINSYSNFSANNFDTYRWDVQQLPADQTSFKVPLLPTNLAGYEPQEGSNGRKYYVGILVSEAFEKDGGSRSAWTSLNLSNNRNLSTQSLDVSNAQHLKEQSTDKDGIQLK